MTITGVDPRTGNLAGEQPVAISGTNFRTDIGYTVYFGNKQATSVTILSDSTIRATTPMVDDPATVDIILTADNGPAFRIAQAFTFQDTGAAAPGTPTKRGNLAY